MHVRADVLERLRTSSHRRSRNDLAAAQTYPGNPNELNRLAWELVKRRGHDLPGFQKALRFAEEACQLEPESGFHLNTLGVVYYRLGSYEKALDVLSRSDRINALRDKGSVPADLAFLAMAHQQLGHAKEAKAALLLLRERAKDRRWERNFEIQGFLLEAEELLAKPEPAVSK